MLTLEQARREWNPILPKQLAQPSCVSFSKQTVSHYIDLSSVFPHTLNQPLLQLEAGLSKTHKNLRIGLFFSGGQAPGGHNVVAGLWDTLVGLNPQHFLH